MAEAMNVLADESGEVLKRNKAQLKKGFSKNLKKLKKYRDQEYAVYKNQKNPEPGLGNPDLNETGDFWRGFRLKVLNKNQYDILSTDSKNDMLVKKYGEDIFGMSDDSKEDFVKNIYRDKLKIKVNQVLKL